MAAEVPITGNRSLGVADVTEYLGFHLYGCPRRVAVCRFYLPGPVERLSQSSAIGQAEHKGYGQWIGSVANNLGEAIGGL